jgi:hypothetical protein
MATTTGTVTNAISASYVEYSNVADKPALISGSSQVSYTGLSDIPAGIVSGSTQVSFNGITDKPALVSSSAQIVEYNVFATTGSNQFDGSQAITGSLTVTGQVVAQTLNVQQVTSSIVYSSGSNIFGNDLGNTQQFTGSVSVTGSLAVAGTGTFASTVTVQNGNIITLLQPSNGNGSNIRSVSNGDFRVSTGATPDALNINNVGYVGIGTNDPKRGLHVVGTSAGAEVTITETAMAVGSKNFNIVGNSTNGTWSLRTLTDNSLAQSVNFVSFTASTGAATFSNSVTAGGTQYLTNTSTGTDPVYQRILNTGGDAIIGINANTGASLAAGGLAYATSIYNNTNTAIQFGTNAIFNMTILAGGNVGINTNSPTNLLHLTGNSATPSLRLGSISVGFHWDIGRENASTGDFVFNSTNTSTGTTEKMRVTQDSAAYLRMASGTGGIQFNGDTAASNALDDYEEGTWTPTVKCDSGTATYDLRLGTYTKIGRMVTITFFISFSKNTLSGGDIEIIDFPFTLQNGGGTNLFYPQTAVLFDNLSTTTNNITLQGTNNTNTGVLIGGNGSTTSHSGLSASTLGSNPMSLRGTLTYFT